MIEGLQLTIPHRMSLVRITLTLGLIISVALSFNLWAGQRDFPHTPLFTNFGIGAPLDILIITLVLILWVASLVMRWQRLLLFFSLALTALLVFSDINRLQPWLYVYGAMLLVFVFYNGRVDDSNRFTSYFIILQIIVASVYFFCGISQFNSHFVDSQFTEIIGPLKSIASERQFNFFVKLGVCVPYVLLFIGIGLIISPIRYLAITLAVVLHVFLFVLMFPLSGNHNYALWFSNLPFGIMVVLLFSGKTKQRYFSPSYLFQTPLFYATVVLFVIMPFFNSAGYWPDYLSANFKSGKNKSVEIRVSESTYQQLPFYQRSFCVPTGKAYSFDYNGWCSNELKVECFPEKPVFNSIYAYLERLETANVKETELAQLGGQNILRKP
ncbi:MAG: hypothetical protein IT236_17720 [Bacteroidia bacterium]|nr:hypothetical protein [Bacteroidia bacterium]